MSDLVIAERYKRQLDAPDGYYLVKFTVGELRKLIEELSRAEQGLADARKVLDSVHKTLVRGTLEVKTTDEVAAYRFLRMSEMIGKYYGDKPHPDYRPITAPPEPQSKEVDNG